MRLIKIFIFYSRYQDVVVVDIRFRGKPPFLCFYNVLLWSQYLIEISYHRPIQKAALIPKQL